MGRASKSVTRYLDARAVFANSERQPIVIPYLSAAFVLYWVLLNTFTTQYIAAHYHYAPALGPAWLGKVYHPLSWMRWVWRYYVSDSRFMGQVALAHVVAVIVGVLGLRASVGVVRRPARFEGLHGTAHFATEEEIRDAGLLPKPGQPGAGAYVGGWVDSNGELRYLRHNGPEHIALIAPTRSGKGVGCIVPTLLGWGDSVLVTDPKGELWHLTAGCRSTELGNECYRFNPGSADSCAMNALDEIRLGTINEVGDAQNIATMLVDPEGKGMEGEHGHWQKTAWALLIGVMLYVLYEKRAQGKSGCLPDVAYAISDPSRPVSRLYQEMLHNQFGTDPVTGQPCRHEAIASAAQEQLQRPPDEGASVVSTAASYLAIYKDPLIRRNTDHSDVRLIDLVEKDKPVTLYIDVPSEDKDRLRPIIRLLLTQVPRVLLRRELQFKEGRAQSPYKHRLLLLIDEFPSYGKLDVFVESLAYIASHGLKAYLVIQDTTQLAAVYGDNDTILSNTHVRIVYAPNRYETAELISKMAGEATVIKEHVSISGARFGILDQTSRDFQQERRALLTPDEVMRLPEARKDGSTIVEAGAMLIFVAGKPPIYGKQSLYFMDQEFLRRSRIPPPPPHTASTAAHTAQAPGTPRRLKRPVKPFVL